MGFWEMNVEAVSEVVEFSNPQTNRQYMLSYMTSAQFGSPRGLVSCCKT